MESDKEIMFYDNDTELNYKESVDFLKRHFSKELAAYKSEREYYDSNGYWGIFFVHGVTEIFLGSERSFLAFGLKINESNIHLSKVDSRITKLERTSKKNFLFLVDLIKQYLESDYN